ncbi:S1C family serine protease [Streptomyces sp. Da 82-17]|uniref:S1C family serine protease n=1 Tax=Streptomyces sp. Da 82-17 TaxID=3377116 RepID=UPI0038D3D6EC
MDEGKPTGPKAKWWSRPAERTSEDRERVPDGETSEDRGAREETGDDSKSPSAEASSQTTQAGQTTQSAQPAQAAEGSQDSENSGAASEGAAAATPASAPKAKTGVTIAKGAASGTQEARPKPLHDPDPYGTPPYGEPGPWAPAPPVQRPVPTPAQGTAVQPPAPQGTPAQGTSVPAYAVPPTQHAQTTPAPTPAPAAAAAPAQGTPPHGTTANGTPHQPQPQPQAHPQPQAQPHPQGQWQQYDPWRAPQGQQPLVLADGPAPAKAPRRGRLFVAALVLALVAGGVGGGIGAYLERHGGITTVELPQADTDAKQRPPDSVAGIAASALPSVVTLHVSGGSAQGTGTGFVLDDKGHILTNNHVVEPAGDGGEVSVTFSGGEVAKGRVVGRDSGYDLAVVKVSGVSGLKPLPLGNSDDVQVGDPVVAIGAPFDLSNTVTSGIISAKERPITAGGEEGDGSDVSYVDALQTDAPINPGNSGGPLVDHKARVIGINSAIRSAGSGSELDGGQSGSIGLGFAIPINQAKRVAEELINTGKATHPVIEVTLDTRYTGDGARVAKQGANGGPAVAPGGPGAKAGIEPGDVITEVDGQRVHSGEELIVKIRAHRPGDRLELTLERDGEERTLSLELGAAGG